MFVDFIRHFHQGVRGLLTYASFTHLYELIGASLNVFAKADDGDVVHRLKFNKPTATVASLDV